MSDDAAVLKALQKLPNIGPACAKDLLLIGIHSVEDLKGKEADALYGDLCEKTGHRHDPCVRDTFEAAIHFANTGERRTWWSFTEGRKKRDSSE